MESKYLKRFERIKNGEHFVLKGDKLIVEVLPKEEFKTAGGLIIQTHKGQVHGGSEEGRSLLGVVLLTGAGYVDDDGQVEDLELKPGMIVLLTPEGIQKFTQFPGVSGFTPDDIAMTRESHISLFWNSFEQYQAYKAQLNA